MTEQANDQTLSVRVLSIDALRGLIMILMALDHASYFIAQKHSSEHWGGSLPVYPDALSFLTRWITHLAPTGFFFLMGIGMYLFAQSRRKQGWSEWAITRHLSIRGASLIALKFTLVNRAWEWGPAPFPRLYIGVLFALGGGMILSSLLLRFKPAYLLVVTGVLCVGLQFIYPSPSQWGQTNPLGLVFLYSGGNLDLWSNYPILPWLGLITFGIVWGHWLSDDSGLAYRRALVLGITFMAAFGATRYLNGWGNIRPRAGDSWIDWLNVVKYPPSLAFLLLTAGIDLILLWFFSQLGNTTQGILKSLAVLGQVPLFFYILHLFLYLGLGRWLAPQGTSLPLMYPIWLLGLAILYPLCLWYGRFKHGQPANSLWRFL